MKFSVNWLREFVDLSESVDELSQLLTLAGVEIESVEQRGAKIDQVIVAQITASSQHPNADRLTVCEVDDGSGTKRQIVCGAKNYKIGDKIPLALPGAKLPNGLEIKKSKLRGVDSEGMLCSAIELKLGEDASGLLILPPEARIGAPLVDLFPSDTILDVEITPNRGDLLSHYGLAREIAALTEKKLKSLPVEAKLDRAKSGVKISAPHECPFFSARKIDNVKVGPSPAWLRAKIEAAGVRSINNIVDISNFVMIELGQPTHAFDADKLRGGINVRLARDGEKFLALDGKTYSLTPENLVIGDDEGAVGIGGVMGGEETGVTESTRNVLLEAAYFLPASIRRTARNLNLPSDASYRFERGVDPGMILQASQRASELIREIANGNPAKQIAVAGKLPPDPPDVSLTYTKCDQLLGVQIKAKAVDQILERFGLSKKGNAEKTGSKWKIPSYRRDLQRDVDLIEEVVRAYGVEKIAGTDRSRFTATSAADQAHDLLAAIRQTLVGRSFCEIKTSTLIPEQALEKDSFPHHLPERLVRLKNPLGDDTTLLRPSLIPGLLQVLETNLRAGARRIRLFELGRTFRESEDTSLGLLLTGPAQLQSWQSGEPKPSDIFELKGVIESLPLADIQFEPFENSNLKPAVYVWKSGIQIGHIGQLRSQLLRDMRLNFPVLVAAVILRDIESLDSLPAFREIERFPAITRDIAMIVPDKISHGKIEQVIRGAREPLLESVQLFDLFEGSEIGPARKSLAYSLTYRDRVRTLTNEEVTAAHAKIRERLQHELGAELRE